jgi:hypothetical protein
MERYSSYTRLLSSLRSSIPQGWYDLAWSFPKLGLNERKAGISFFRAKRFPLYDNSAYDKKVTPFLLAMSNIFDEKTSTLTLSEIIQQPDSSGFFLSLLLSAPYSREQVSLIFSTMVHKEVSVMESTPRHPTIQWNHLLTDHEALSIDLRPSPNTNRAFRYAIDRWTTYLQNTVIYPFSSTKTLSKSTTREFNRLSGNSFDDICPLQLEQYYSQTGTTINSPCEMRQVWYPTFPTPRTYYAMGGTAYFKARYLRDVFNVLADYFPSTNRYSRVQPSHVTYGSNEDVYVYDLTSFTSLYHEQRYFLDFLAALMDGVEIIIFDTHSGFRKVFLSEMIREYNTLNKEPEYSMERIWNIDLVLHHSVAGFLGVYGNLITCTIPHGLSLMTLRDVGLKSWCAGDDGGSIGNKKDGSHENDLRLMTASNGELQWEKVFVSKDGDAMIALKRLLLCLPGSLHLVPNVLFPPFSVFFDKDYRFDDHRSKDEDPCSTFCSGLLSMLYQMSLSDFGESDVSFLKDFLPVIYKHMALPFEGFFPPLCGHVLRYGRSSLSFTVPRILGDFWQTDPNRALLDAFMPDHFHGTYSEELPWDGIVRDEWQSNGDKLLSMAVRMGYLEREEVRVTYVIEEDVRSAVYREYLRDHDSRNLVYQFRMIDDVPAHYSLE